MVIPISFENVPIVEAQEDSVHTPQILTNPAEVRDPNSTSSNAGLTHSMLSTSVSNITKSASMTAIIRSETISCLNTGTQKPRNTVKSPFKSKSLTRQMVVSGGSRRNYVSCPSSILTSTTLDFAAPCYIPLSLQSDPGEAGVVFYSILFPCYQRTQRHMHQLR